MSSRERDRESGTSVAGAESSPNAIRLLPPDRAAAQIDGLIRLLVDDDPRIIATVCEHLGELFDLAEPQLVERAGSASSERERLAVSEFLREQRRANRMREWESFVRGGVKTVEDLERGALLIASTEYPELDLAAASARLDEIGRVLAGRLSPSRETRGVVSKLNHLLFREQGFRGNRESYCDPDNSYFNRVLERRLGIPISLSLLTIFVARRVGCELDGIGMPGHFLVRYREGRRDVYIDPFNGGREWTLEDCLHYLRGEGYVFTEEYLRAYAPADVLIRMLGNLLGVYQEEGDEERESRVTRLLESLR